MRRCHLLVAAFVITTPICAGCVSPVVLDPEALRIGLFHVESRTEKELIRRTFVQGAGLSIGPRILALGLVSTDTLAAPLDSGAYRVEWPGGWIAVGDEAIRSVQEVLPLRATVNPRRTPNRKEQCSSCR